MTIFRKILATTALCLAAMGVSSCQQLQLWSAQAEYNRKHEEWCQLEYNSHVEKLNSGAIKLQQSLPKAVRAEWQWIYDCDACDDSLLPAPVKLSRNEFEQMVTLLRQAKAMPPLPQSAFMTPAPRLKRDSQGNVLRPVQINPMFICCGGVSPVLVFYDIDNEVNLYWDLSMTIPLSRVPEHRHKKVHLRPNLVLPDAAYQQLLTLPSTLKVSQMDAELQKKIKAYSQRRVNPTS